MTSETLSRTDLEFVELIRSTDEKGKALILDALICTAAFGDDFLKEWGTAIDSGDSATSEAVIHKWKQAAQEKVTVNQWGA